MDDDAVPTRSAQLFLEHSRDVMTVHDLSGAITYASPASTDLLGHAPGELQGRFMMELVHPEDVDAVVAARERLVLHGHARFECRLRTASGRYLWVDTSMRVVRDERGEPMEVHGTTRDVSAHRLADQRFELALLHAPIGMALVALDGSFISANPALEQMLGVGEGELEGRRFQDVTHPDDLELDLELLEECLRGVRHGYSMDKRYVRSDRSILWATLAVVLVRDPGGQPLHFISQIVDISERKALELSLSAAALSDPLTGLANRAAAVERLHALSLGGGGFGVCFCDLRGFKSINDRLGHRSGDAVLCEVGTRLRSVVRSHDLVSRWGGDEFVVVLSPVSSATELDGAARRLLDAVCQPFELSGRRLQLAMNVGTSFAATGTDVDVTELVARADEDMYGRRSAQIV